jgi:hypothetical protein
MATSSREAEVVVTPSTGEERSSRSRGRGEVDSRVEQKNYFEVILECNHPAGGPHPARPKSHRLQIMGEPEHDLSYRPE